jgi:hypothetical protein
VHELVDDSAVQDRVDDEVELGPAAKPLDVRQRPGLEVVERPHLRALIEQQLAEVGADESGAARDEGFSVRARHRPDRLAIIPVRGLMVLTEG